MIKQITVFLRKFADRKIINQSFYYTMKRKKLITALMGLAALPAVAAGSQAPLWMRYPAISPDGKTVAFSYKGDIYTVPPVAGTV